MTKPNPSVIPLLTTRVFKAQEINQDWTLNLADFMNVN